MPPGEPPFQSVIHGLYSEHHGWLFTWLRKKLGCAHNAADLAHDTFMRILTARESVNGIREPRAYLSTTARRLIIDQARRKQIENSNLQELLLTVDLLEGFQSPEQVLCTLEALEQIAFVLEGMHQNMRQAFVLYYLDGLTQCEIARQLKVSDRTVRSYLVQALVHCSHTLDT